MKKENRLIKINDNFSSIEIYYNDSGSLTSKDVGAEVIVTSRTFSGRYTCRFDREAVADFNIESLTWLEKLVKGKEDAGDDAVFFRAVDDALSLEVRGISPTKVAWTIVCKPFLQDIEVLRLRLETEANLVRGVSSWVEKITVR